MNKVAFDGASVTKTDGGWYTLSVYCKGSKGMVSALAGFPYGRLGSVKIWLLRKLIKLMGGGIYFQVIRR